MTTKLTSISLLALIVLTGHFGGSLTHGPDFLTGALKGETDTVTVRKPIANIQEAVVYEDVIQPVLQTKCYSCHSRKKQKGGLRMDDPELLLKGGKSGETILPGKAEESELVKRLLLPLEDEDHMPPKSKPQLNEREIALVHWWVNSGADFTKKVKDFPQPEKIKPVLLALQTDQQKQKLPPMVPDVTVEKGNEKAIQALKELGVVIIPVAKESLFLTANFVTVPAVTDEQLKLLLPLKKQLVRINLNDTRVSDKGLAYLGECTHLTQLFLNNTGITDKGLAALKTLTHLQVLSLVNTKITAAGLSQLTGLRNLQSLYAYQTGVKAGDTGMLRKQFPTTAINIGGYSLPLLSGDTVKVSAARMN